MATRQLITQQDPGKGVVLLSELFAMQSYFDTTLLHLAVKDQGTSTPLANGTVKSANTAGYGLALHPSSETPVAVKFEKVGSTGATLTVILKPGQVLYPFGRGPEARFEGFSWGLPFGWLGGGLATLYVLTSPDIHLDWTKDDAEVIFHRQRMKIWPSTTAWADINAAAVGLPRNWPTRFPAKNLRRGGTGGLVLDASGSPSIRVQPTRTALMLRAVTPTNFATTRFLIVAPEALENDASVAPPVVAGYQDIAWGTSANAGGLGVPDQYPVQEVIAGPLVTMGCERAVDNGVVAILTGADVLLDAGVYLDVVRYGKI